MSLEGQQLGRYRLQQVLGGGGMGDVYLATDTIINRQVAIKVIRSEASAYPNPGAAQESARLFQREMKAVATLDHPHILPLYDYGEETVNGAKLSYLVMPYRREGSLATWLQQRSNLGVLSPQDVANLVIQAASALQHAHDHQIIHQDVKPANFLIRFKNDDPGYPDLLLADFGVSRLNSATANVSQSIRGTPTSMAPEQWEGHPVPATDQYALAVMAYELLTGRPPFQGGLSQLMYQHFNTMASPPSSINRQLPSDVDDVLLHALAKKPEERFATVSAFARAFQQAVLSNGPTVASASGSMPVIPTNPSIPSTPKELTNIHGVLAISSAEARAGATRTLTLPGGRHITVTVPAGAYDGQLISLQDRGEPGSYMTTLTLRLSVQQVNTTDAPGNAEQTMRTSTPIPQSRPNPVVTPFLGLSPIAPPSPGVEPATPPTPAVQTSGPGPQPVGAVFSTVPGTGAPASPPPVPRKRGSKLRAALLAALALLLVVGSLGIFTIVHNGQLATDNMNATATAQGGVRTNLTSTAFSVNATATQKAINSSNATATASAYQNLYTSATSGTPTLNDPLSDNSLGNGWNEGPDGSGGACTFTGGAYHISETNTNIFFSCFATSTDFSNFAFTVQMKIVKGDCGGLIFRADSTNSKYYFWYVCQNGSYALYAESTSGASNPLATDSSPAFKTGLNQTNVIAVVAQGSTLDLYINQQEVASMIDSTYSHGGIGLMVFPQRNPTEAAYTNAEVWKL